jgi:hypothetical protein
MYTLPAQSLNDLLTPSAQVHCLQCQFRVRSDDTEHIPYGRISIKSQDQVRRCQVKKMHPVGLYKLPHMQQLAEQLRRPRQFQTGDAIAGFRRRQVVAYRADTADALGYCRHLKIWATLGEFL